MCGCFSEETADDDDGQAAVSTSTGSVDAGPGSASTSGPAGSEEVSGGSTDEGGSEAADTGGSTGSGTTETGAETGTEGAECRHRSFVSSDQVAYATLDAGGANGRCDADAVAADLGGDWIALLPLDGESARERFEPCGPVVTVGDEPVASAELFWTDIHEGPIDVLATGTAVLGTDRVYTGTAFDGAIEHNCNGWGEEGEHWIGNPSASDGTWLNLGSPLPCPPTTEWRVYCVEVGAS